MFKNLYGVSNDKCTYIKKVINGQRSRRNVIAEQPHKRNYKSSRTRKGRARKNILNRKARELFKQGENLAEKEQWDAAIRKFYASIELNNSDPLPYVRLAGIKGDKGDYKGAIRRVYWCILLCPWFDPFETRKR